MAKKNLKSIKSADATVAVATTAKSYGTVTVLFRNRCGQKFNLSNGHVVELEGNAVYLAGADGAPLPAGGYSVNVIDSDDWELVKKEYGKAYAPWFQTGKIVEENNEKDGVEMAQDNAADDAGLNPFDPKSEGQTEAVADSEQA